MDKKTVLIKTSKGESEVAGMSGDMKRVLLLIDGYSKLDNVIKRAPPSLRGDIPEIIQRLLDAELIIDKAAANSAIKIVSPRIVEPKSESAGEELDFTSMFKSSGPAGAPAPDSTEKALADLRSAEKQKELEQQKARAEAKRLAEIEAKAKAEAELRQRAALEAAAKAKREAEERGRREAEAAARAKAEADRIKAEEESLARARAAAEERKRREEAEAARIRAEEEAQARAKAEAEERKRREAEAARVKAELEAAKARADAEARALAEERKRREEAEAARVKAELEAAKARAEAEARALAEERARRELEERKRREEAEAARIKAEQEAAARAKAEAEERKRREEAEAARVRAEQEAAKARAEAEARALAEERARRELEERKRREEAEAARIKAEQEAADRAKAEAEERKRHEEAEAARVKAEAEKHKQEETAAVPAASVSTPFQIDLGGLQGIESAPVMVEQNVPAQPAVPEPVAAAESKVSIEQVKVETEQPETVLESAHIPDEQEVLQSNREREAIAQEEAQRLAAEQAAAWTEAEQRASLQSKMDVEQAALQASLVQAKELQKASRYRQRRSLPLGKIAAGLLGLALVLTLVLPMFWPMDEYIPPLEQQLSARLGHPVKVGGLKVALLPLPTMEVRQLTMGSKQELTVQHANVHFELMSLFSPDKILDKTELQGIVVDGKQLEQVLRWLKGLDGNGAFSLRQVSLQDVQIKSAEVALPLLQGSAQFADGEFSRLALHDEGDKMQVDLKSVSGRLQIAFGVRESSLPLLPQVVFSDFRIAGEVADGGIAFSELDAHTYNGIWSGSGNLNWRKGWQAEARIDARTMDLDKMFPQYGLEGEIFVNGTFTARGATLAAMADTLRIEAVFEAKRGVINGVDVVETARLLSREHLLGGRTHFDQLNGSALLENHVLRLRQIKISSGMLNASGSFDVAGDGHLSGNFGSEIKMRAGNNPLVLSGTLREPRLQAR